jgi:hypothetical protein
VTLDVLRHLPDEVATRFAALPQDERAWRGRFFLIANPAGYRGPLAWVLALRGDHELEAFARETVERTPDAEIERMVADADASQNYGICSIPCPTRDPYGAR